MPVALGRRPELPGLESRHRFGGTLKREHGRPDEQLEADERRDGVPGQPEDERRSAHAERDRLPGLDRDPPEDLFDAELGLDSRGRGRAARPRHRRRSRVRRPRAPRDRLAMGFLVVGDRRQALGARARRGELRREHQPVGLVDLTGPERLARAREARFPWRERRPAVARHTRLSATPDAASAPSWAGPSACSGRHDALAGANVSAARTNVRTRSNGLGNLDVVAMFDNVLDGDDGIGPLRNAPPVAIPIASPAPSDSRRPACLRRCAPPRAASRACRPRAAQSRPSRSSRNGGRSTSAVAGSASTRPAADSSLTRSAGSGRTRSRIRRCASSIVRSSATIAAYRTRGG